MRVISYNLRKNRAVGELFELVEQYRPDAICLQEADTIDLPDEIGSLTLADSTHRNRLGLAIYFDEMLYSAVETHAFALKKSLHDRLLRPAHERLLGTLLTDRYNGEKTVIASFHAAPLTALNSLRRVQIRSAHEELRRMGDGAPTLMVGDYNYPVFKNGLTERVRGRGYDLTLSDSRTYTRYRFFRGHFDFATSIGLEIGNVATLPRGDSDHMPILINSGRVPSSETVERLQSPSSEAGSYAI